MAPADQYGPASARSEPEMQAEPGTFVARPAAPSDHRAALRRGILGVYPRAEVSAHGTHNAPDPAVAPLPGPLDHSVGPSVSRAHTGSAPPVQPATRKRFWRRKGQVNPRGGADIPVSDRGRGMAATPSSGEPLSATAALERRLNDSAHVATEPGPGFVIDNGTVEPTGDDRRRIRRPSRLAGGRWRRHALLLVTMMALTVLLVNGVYRLVGKALYEPPRPEPGDAFPVAQASGYAARFVHAYLTWDQADPEARSEQLRVFFPDRAETQLGWDGRGVQRVVGQPLPSGVTSRDNNHAVVHVAALIEPGGWTCMDVAVFAADGAEVFAITSYAAFVSCPAVAAVEVPAESQQNDSTVATELTPTINSFFRAYGASSPDLAQIVTPESAITGLRGTVSLVEITRLFVPVADNNAERNERTVEARVRWQMPSGGSVVQTYRLAMRSIGGRWFVHNIDGGVESADVAPITGGVAQVPSRSPSPVTQPTGQPKPSASSSARRASN
jgi:hypothetical protein